MIGQRWPKSGMCREANALGMYKMGSSFFTSPKGFGKFLHIRAIDNKKSIT